MYHALKAFYLISACLNYKKCRKLTNVFILTLDLHKVKIENIVKVFYRLIQELNCDIKLNINDKNQAICTFSMIFLSDMS